MPYVIASWPVPASDAPAVSPYFANKGSTPTSVSGGSDGRTQVYLKDLSAKYAVNWDRLRSKRVSGKQMMWWREVLRLGGMFLFPSGL